MKLKKGEFRSLLRQDFYSFIDASFCELNPETEFLPNWHIEVIASELEKCRRGETKRLIIDVPPRSLKSHCASVVFPAWLLAHNPSEQIICVSYGQDLANSLADQCRTLMTSSFYRELFPTRLSGQKKAVNDFWTTKQGFRMATSVGGVLTGRGANYIIIDDPLKPDQALSEVERKTVNEWFLHTLSSRLNDKQTGCIILIMQRLHEDDLVGHVLGLGQPWKVLRFPSIAEEDEYYDILTPFGPRKFQRRAGEALHPGREPLDVLQKLRQSLGEYNFAGQYQQAPTPLGGGMVKLEWFKRYSDSELPSGFDLIFQSWDTANKPTQLNDYSVCTTWGVKEKRLYLLNVFRQRLDYPALKRAVHDQVRTFNARTVIIEDKASGTQLIQDLLSDQMYSVKKYQTSLDKKNRMFTVCNIIENGFVYLPERALWLGEYLHEISVFDKGKFDDQVDSTSQALDWYKQYGSNSTHGYVEYLKHLEEKLNPKIPSSKTCDECGHEMGRIPGGLRCGHCGAQWAPPRENPNPTRADALRNYFPRR